MQALAGAALGVLCGALAGCLDAWIPDAAEAFETDPPIAVVYPVQSGCSDCRPHHHRRSGSEHRAAERSHHDHHDHHHHQEAKSTRHHRDDKR